MVLNFICSLIRVYRPLYLPKYVAIYNYKLSILTLTLQVTVVFVMIYLFSQDE